MRLREEATVFASGTENPSMMLEQSLQPLKDIAWDAVQTKGGLKL